jgi:hypothetical protein
VENYEEFDAARESRMVIKTKLPRVAGVYGLTVCLTLGACNGVHVETPSGFPGLSIPSRCDRSGDAERSVEEAYPGQRGMLDRSFHHSVLSRMGETPLSCSPDHAVSYRFLQSVVLSPRDIVVSITRRGDAFHSTAIVWDREQDEEIERSQKILTSDQWLKVRSAMEMFDFWQRPTNEMPSPRSGALMDGGRIAIEGHWHRRYHVVLRQTNDQEAAKVFDAVLEALELGDWNRGSRNAP